ncbi:MAG: pentapeptide repeat-containing protein [bacterium]|nr:pentapeptide repeat-containing protein [bacterium]
MDFADQHFEDASFSGRILYNASFRNCTFDGTTKFQGVTFIGITEFADATFEGVVRFDDATFLNTTYFKNAVFKNIAVFDRSTFKYAAYFQDAEFQPADDPENGTEPGTGFSNAKFENEARFDNSTFHSLVHFNDATFLAFAGFEATTFMGDASFERSTFSRQAGFSLAAFKKIATFNNALFRASTSFNQTQFTQPPRFFETQLHEDTDFENVDWRMTESFYAPSWWQSVWEFVALLRTPSPPSGIDSAIRAWDRLALIMSRLEKFHERHTFHRLRMRAHRWKEGRGLLSLSNGLFDRSSDYGWSVPRALLVWLGHIILGALVLFIDASYPFSCASCQWEHLAGGAVLTSFANAHAFLGLASEGGYLEGARATLNSCKPDGWIRNAVGTVQAVLGPITLFLVLLTLRNRFRLG